MFFMWHAGGNMKFLWFFVFHSLQSPVTWPLQLTIALKKEDSDPDKNQYNEYFYAGGLIEYVTWLNTDKVCLTFNHLHYFCSASVVVLFHLDVGFILVWDLLWTSLYTHTHMYMFLCKYLFHV